ncbi:aminotransferase class I/II-fold pyridoxal phosphate-dependent enzyme [Actinomadura rubrisoli]|uniref:Aminotransferase class I/II-fold pyridoxal phosphate-dependent enzyme n=1 Tax=Actinomadura rubrisoli TaxID=2530368 RepID=A0A4R5CA61_9ACTN|nr:aminotransferase class I/II-fold pyridoxal phosphate-dependent enzyme [Actinomadura rubrisoli]TDD96801.1 aminotransferase class I/II-fold pyridoxal phosphate-dependent enzyme [Actinomadura rubrisoli]
MAAFNDMHRLLAQAEAQDVLDHRIRVDGAHPNVLDGRLTNPDSAVFVSDWNGAHPFTGIFLGSFLTQTIESLGGLSRYSHLEEDTTLQESIARLHAERYGEPLRSSRCFIPGTGSASFLTTLLFRAQQLGLRRLCYFPPVYNSAVHLIRNMGFAVRQVADDVDFADDPGLRLPNTRCVLWLTDPVWFAGRRVRRETIDEVARWQQRTGSLVFVDGTFQYLNWGAERREFSSDLDPGLTYRLVCPTKALALHGFRFAYLIVPERDSSEMIELHSILHGAAGIADRTFAHRALKTLREGAGNGPLTEYARNRYHELIESQAFEEWIAPEGGYFVFGRPAAPPDTLHGMGPECFGMRGTKGHVRVNLLSERGFTHLKDWGLRQGSPRSEGGPHAVAK